MVLQAYRTINVEVEAEKTYTIEIPFTVELLRHVEETIHECEGKIWFRFSAKQKSIIESFEKFAKRYIPSNIDLSQTQPNFTALFFSSVRDALMTSMNDCRISMLSIQKPLEPTDEKTTATAPESA